MLAGPPTEQPAQWPTWREAWQRALYGPDGFFVRERPGDHFRTSVHASPLFAEAVLTLAGRHGLTRIVDLGAGGGELLTHLRRLDADIGLVGIDLAPRPPGVPGDVGWQAELPERLTGLVIANEWLDNVPCDVVEADAAGAARLVHVDPLTGREARGEVVTDPWLQQWWPLTEPGSRAEIGRPRDDAWSDVLDRLDHGLAVAVDYGHTRERRPPFGSLTSYRRGHEVDVVPDGSRDVTAHVAVDALRSDRRCSQRAMLHDLGVRGDRPPVTMARSDPRGYVRALGRSSEAAELTERGGLGDLTWVLHSVGCPQLRNRFGAST